MISIWADASSKHTLFARARYGLVWPRCRLWAPRNLGASGERGPAAISARELEGTRAVKSLTWATHRPRAAVIDSCSPWLIARQLHAERPLTRTDAHAPPGWSSRHRRRPHEGIVHPGPRGSRRRQPVVSTVIPGSRLRGRELKSPPRAVTGGRRSADYEPAGPPGGTPVLQV
jgi:hypothetical protein